MLRRKALRKVSAKKAAQIIKEKELAQRLYVRQKGKCAECGKPLNWDWRGFSKHEKVFRSHGGDPTDEKNCDLRCAPCHDKPHLQKSDGKMSI